MTACFASSRRLPPGRSPIQANKQNILATFALVCSFKPAARASRGPVSKMGFNPFSIVSRIRRGRVTNSSYITPIYRRLRDRRICAKRSSEIADGEILTSLAAKSPVS